MHKLPEMCVCLKLTLFKWTILGSLFFLFFFFVKGCLNSSLFFLTDAVAAVDPERQGMSPGSTVNLQCSHTSSDPSVEYSWSREDGQPIPMDSGRFERGGRNMEILRITLAEASDSGVYICTVTTDDGDLTARATVIIGKFESGFSVWFFLFAFLVKDFVGETERERESE